MELCSSTYIDYVGDHGQYGCLVLMDTDREKSIDLGPDYPFGKLNPGECIIPTGLANKLSVGDKTVEIGTTIGVLMNLKNITNT